MGERERAVGRCSEASTKIGSQPPAKQPTQPACPPATIPPCHPAPRIREDTTSQPRAQQARILDQRHPCCCCSSIPPILPVPPDFPLLPSRCNDNNSDAPLRCLVLNPKQHLRFNTNKSLQAPRNAVTFTSTPPSQHANKTSRHAHNSPHL